MLATNRAIDVGLGRVLALHLLVAHLATVVALELGDWNFVRLSVARSLGMICTHGLPAGDSRGTSGRTRRSCDTEDDGASRNRERHVLLRRSCDR